jgi:hypothetical protein
MHPSSPRIVRAFCPRRSERIEAFWPSEGRTAPTTAASAILENWADGPRPWSDREVTDGLR